MLVTLGLLWKAACACVGELPSLLSWQLALCRSWGSVLGEWPSQKPELGLPAIWNNPYARKDVSKKLSNDSSLPVCMDTRMSPSSRIQEMRCCPPVTSRSLLELCIWFCFAFTVTVLWVFCCCSAHHPLKMLFEERVLPFWSSSKVTREWPPGTQATLLLGQIVLVEDNERKWCLTGPIFWQRWHWRFQTVRDNSGEGSNVQHGVQCNQRSWWWRGRVKASSSCNCDLCSPRPRIFVAIENIQAFNTYTWTHTLWKSEHLTLFVGIF